MIELKGTAFSELHLYWRINVSLCASFFPHMSLTKSTKRYKPTVYICGKPFVVKTLLYLCRMKVKIGNETEMCWYFVICLHKLLLLSIFEDFRDGL